MERLRIHGVQTNRWSVRFAACGVWLLLTPLLAPRTIVEVQTEQQLWAEVPGTGEYHSCHQTGETAASCNSFGTIATAEASLVQVSGIAAAALCFRLSECITGNSSFSAQSSGYFIAYGRTGPGYVDMGFDVTPVQAIYGAAFTYRFGEIEGSFWGTQEDRLYFRVPITFGERVPFLLRVEGEDSTGLGEGGSLSIWAAGMGTPDLEAPVYGTYFEFVDDVPEPGTGWLVALAVVFVFRGVIPHRALRRGH